MDSVQSADLMHMLQIAPQSWLPQLGRARAHVCKDFKGIQAARCLAATHGLRTNIPIACGRHENQQQVSSCGVDQ